MNWAGYADSELRLVPQHRAELGKRHRPGVVPGVDDLGHPARLAAARRAGQRDAVHERPVRVQPGQVAASQSGQLGQRPHTGQVALAALPQGQRRAPVPAPRQRPVHVVAQPLAVPAITDGRRVPPRPRVLRQQLILDRGGADVPGRQRIVEQRRAAPPAVRVAVPVRLGPEQPPRSAEVAISSARRPEEHPADQRQVLVEPAVRPDRVDHRQAVLPPGVQVVRAERGREVHQAGAVVGGDETGRSPRGARRASSTSENGGRMRLRPGSAPSNSASTCQPSPSTRPTALRDHHDPVTVRGLPGHHVRSSGCTATAVLATSVHGVVVQTSRSAPGSSGRRLRRSGASSGNLTVTAGSVTPGTRRAGPARDRTAGCRIAGSTG